MSVIAELARRCRNGPAWLVLVVVAAGITAAAAGSHAGTARHGGPPELSSVIAGLATTASPGPFVLKNLSGDQCLDISAAPADRHAVQSACVTRRLSASLDWQWGRESPTNGGFYQLVSGSGRCLRLAGGRIAPGTDLVEARCDGRGGADEYWEPASGLPTCTKQNARYWLLVNLKAAEGPVDGALIAGVSPDTGTAGPARITLRQWAGPCGNEYWAAAPVSAA
jgi:hypothetical protein